jgi:peroxiredoxin
MAINQIVKFMNTSSGKTVHELSLNKTVLLVFLRHFECVFCRESLIELAKKRALIVESEVELVFVHMSSNETADKYFNKFDLEGYAHVSDPECKYYLAFGLVKGRFDQLFGLRTAMRGFEVSLTKGIFPSISTVGDGLQMPGIFIIQGGETKSSFIHTFAADKPDYDKLINCCTLNN